MLAVACTLMAAACGTTTEVSNTAINVASNTSSGAPSNTANTANTVIDVKRASADVEAADSTDAAAAPAESGKEIKPAEGFKMRSIEPVEGTIIGGILNGYASSLPDPEYPPAAKAAKASGKVPVEVVVNEKGIVSSVSVVEGPQPLRAAAAAAARQAKFEPFLKDGKPVKVAGVINYEFAD